MTKFINMPLSPEHIINQVKRTLQSGKTSEIRLNANGGNSILIVCPPENELDFIDAINREMNAEEYTIIDLNQLLIKFIEQHRQHINEVIELLKGSVKQVFKAPKDEIGPDFFRLILSEIQTVFMSNKIPVLIHAGALYGADIENIHLMESDLIMKSNIPLIILYPAIQEGEQLLFLNSRPASKYRCMIVN